MYVKILLMRYRFILQGVHSSVELEEHMPWKEGDIKMSKLILIGKDLNADIVIDSFQKSLGIPIKLEDELLRPPPSFLGIFLLVLMVGVLIYPGDLFDLVRVDLICAALAIMVALYFHQQRSHPWNSL
jgi:hypothetical protein